MKAFTKNEAKAISGIKDVLQESIGEREITAEAIAEAVCSYNSNLEYDEVMEDITKVEEGGNYFKSAYSRLSEGRSVSFAEQIEKELPDDMSESERKGYYSALYTVLSAKEETPEEVAARADMTLEEQKAILGDCGDSQVDEIAAQFSEQLRENWIFREGSDAFSDEFDQEAAEVELSKQKERSALLDAAAVYTAAQSGAISGEWKNPELLGITFAARETFVRESILSGQLQNDTADGEEERDTFIRDLLKIIVLTVLLAVAAVLLTKGLFAFSDFMIAGEAALTGAALAAHIAVEILGSAVLIFTAAASAEAAVMAGIYIIYKIVSRAADYFRNRRQVTIYEKGCDVIESMASFEEPEDDADDEMDAEMNDAAYA